MVFTGSGPVFFGFWKLLGPDRSRSCKKMCKNWTGLDLKVLVKIIDKSYLDIKFYVDGASDLIDSTVENFMLNEEQEHAFHIITNHAVSKNPEHIRKKGFGPRETQAAPGISRDS